MRAIPKTLKKISLSFLLLFLFFSFSQTIYATDFKPQVSIPDSQFQKGSEIPISKIKVGDEELSTTKTLGEYIQSIYTYSISIVGIVATIMLMFGGFVWLTAGGSGDKVGKARDIIFGSLTGLVLALTSYTLLNMINPNLVNFKVLNIKNASSEGDIEIECGPNKECPTGYHCSITGMCKKTTINECTIAKDCVDRGPEYICQSGECVHKDDTKKCGFVHGRCNDPALVCVRERCININNEQTASDPSGCCVVETGSRQKPRCNNTLRTGCNVGGYVTFKTNEKCEEVDVCK